MIDLNVASHLARFTAAEPHRAAVVIARSGRQLTFEELHRRSDALAHGLNTAGIGPGTRVAVMVPPSLDFFTLVFALFKTAAVPVMIDPGMGVRNLTTCLEQAKPQAFIGIPRAHLARLLFRWAPGAITVNVGRWRPFCRHSTASLIRTGSNLGAYTCPSVQPRDMAAILYTSGSTGLAKGAIYTHAIFAAQVDMLHRMYGIEPGEVDLCTFPLFALFGPALGMTCIVPRMNFARPATIDAARTAATIERYGVTNFFGSPAVIRRFAAYGKPLPTLRRAISAGAPATLAEIAAFARLLPAGAQVFTPYGATEALPVANIGSDELLTTREQTESGRGICIGRPAPGVTVHVIPIIENPLPEFRADMCLPPGEVGELVARGPVVTHAYWKLSYADELSKMHDPATGETLHRMGDVGYHDAEGRLWFCGRKSQRVVTSHGTLFTEIVEQVLNAKCSGGRVALVGVPRGGAEVPVIVCEPRPGFDPQSLLRGHPLSEQIRTVLVYGSRFPVDRRHNSKINRERLAYWAADVLRGDKTVS